jgi:hypothetical protein
VRKTKGDGVVKGRDGGGIIDCLGFDEAFIRTGCALKGCDKKYSISSDSLSAVLLGRARGLMSENWGVWGIVNRDDAVDRSGDANPPLLRNPDSHPLGEVGLGRDGGRSLANLGLLGMVSTREGAVLMADDEEVGDRNIRIKIVSDAARGMIGSA